MNDTLNYGKLTWSYDNDFDPKIPCRPSPIISFSPTRFHGKLKYPVFSDKVSLLLIKHTGQRRVSFKEAYLAWQNEKPCIDRDLGEGRSFLKWLQRNDTSITWNSNDFKLHSYFIQKNSPKHDTNDEMARDLTFAVSPVIVNKRKVKLYLQDEAVLNLITLAFGEEEDFLELVSKYVSRRFLWESWRAPAPPFLDWVKAQAKRPVFSSGQLGFCY